MLAAAWSEDTGAGLPRRRSSSSARMADSHLATHAPGKKTVADTTRCDASGAGELQLLARPLYEADRDRRCTSCRRSLPRAHERPHQFGPAVAA